MQRRAWLLLLGLLACVAVGPAGASERNHKYKDKEPVVLWVNKVGPFNNPQETYNYYALPYCRARPSERPAHSWGGLGEVLQGNELIHSQLDVKFKGALLPVRAVNCFERRETRLMERHQCSRSCAAAFRSVALNAQRIP